MKVTRLTRDVLACRRERLQMERDGWIEIGLPLVYINGAKYREKIIDAKVSVSRRQVWVKTAEPE